MKPQLCLGTAQFGMTYGITNNQGQVSEKAVAEILTKAAEAGISWIDTAQAYGNAEEVIGRVLPKESGFQFLSKLSAQPKTEYYQEDTLVWEKAFQMSCKRLRVSCMESLMLHHAADLKKPGKEYLEEWLIGLRNRGIVKRLGVSIYTADDLACIDRRLLDIVQLPTSLYDQRVLRNGTIEKLRSSGIAIHARSIYMQGLLLTKSQEWPSWISPRIKEQQRKLERLAERKGCELIDLALGFAKDLNGVEAVVLGVCSSVELGQLKAAWERPSPWGTGEWKEWAFEDCSILDPRSWPSR